LSTKSEKINGLIQSATAIAIVLGLVLVIYELQQGREIAKVEQADAGFSGYASSVRSLIGDNGAEAFANACDNPDELSTEDMLIMVRVLEDLLSRVRLSLYRQSISEDLNAYTFEKAIGNFRHIFATEFGRWWWATTQQYWEPEIVQAGNDYHAQGTTQGCKEYFDLYQNRNKTLEAN